jgi:hypothetical protein
MDALIIRATDHTPDVVLDKKNGVFEIKGQSYAKNAPDFYKPILNWLKDYNKNPNENTIFNFKLRYFNTSSSKVFLDIMMALEQLQENEHNIIINWHYIDDDEDMLEAGEGYDELIDVPFNYISYKI